MRARVLNFVIIFSRDEIIEFVISSNLQFDKYFKNVFEKVTRRFVQKYYKA